MVAEIFQCKHCPIVAMRGRIRNAINYTDMEFVHTSDLCT